MTVKERCSKREKKKNSNFNFKLRVAFFFLFWIWRKKLKKMARTRQIARMTTNGKASPMKKTGLVRTICEPKHVGIKVRTTSKVQTTNSVKIAKCWSCQGLVAWCSVADGLDVPECFRHTDCISDRIQCRDCRDEFCIDCFEVRRSK